VNGLTLGVFRIIKQKKNNFSLKNWEEQLDQGISNDWNKNWIKRYFPKKKKKIEMKKQGKTWAGKLVFHPSFSGTIDDIKPLPRLPGSLTLRALVFLGIVGAQVGTVQCVCDFSFTH
jgi:hypothetical protein